MDTAPPSSIDANPAPQRTLSYEGRKPEEASASVPSTLARGTSIHRYIILDRVGEGGMSVVYAAYDPSLDRRVALKFLAPHDADRHGVREKRLLREAQAMARLSHPNVVVAFDVATFQGHVFIAMEFVDGVDLRTWLAEKPRSPSQILDIFRAAGRGLAAAHAAGIIHRDFKPENVLLDRQQRPRVTDFGLSRATHDPEEEGEAEQAAEDRATVLSTPSHLSSPLTRTGGVLGTPSYMPPEQRLGGVVDARSDQFSFCVALYEAIYDEYPFQGSLAERAANAMAGRVAPAPAQSSVPKWCRQALLRGLNPAPEDRFDSMEALLAALSPHPMSRRRRIAIAVPLAAIVAGLGAYGLFFDRAADRPGPRCDLGAQRLAGVWDEARKDQLRDAFLRSGARGASATWKSFSDILDERASAWAAMHNEACAATHIDGAQSPAVLDLRMECLDRKRQEVADLVDVYSDKPDSSSLDRAVAAADRLPSVSACADVANLRAVVPLPEDPSTRARVKSLRQRLSHSNALYEVGRYEQGLEYTKTLKEEADAIGYAPLAAEAANALARHLNRVGEAEVAEKVLFDAVKHAVQGRDWRLEAETWLELVASYPRNRPAPETLLTARMAELAIDRANGDDVLRARLANNTGLVEVKVANYNEAIRHLKRAAELYGKSLRVHSPEFARALTDIGFSLLYLDRAREALNYLERALSLQRAILRPGHPDIVASLRQVGWAYTDLGQFQKALEAFQSSLAIDVQERGSEHVATTYSLRAIAKLEAQLGNVDRALEIFAKVLSIRQKARDPHGMYLGSAYGHLGEIQRRAGLNREAERSLRRVVEIYVRAGLSEDYAIGYALTDLGFVHNSYRRHSRALRECRRAHDILSRKFGPDSGQLIDTRECLGEALIAAGDFDGARKELERALSSIKQVEKGPQWTAGARFQLARALWATPGERPRARELARTTLNELSAAEGDNQQLIARIESWIRTHGESSIREK